MSEPKRLDAAALLAELSKLPNLASASEAHLHPVQAGLARAVRSGQDAEQLARELTAPAGWPGLDLEKASKNLASHESAPTVDGEQALAPAAPPAQPPAEENVPEWISRVAALPHDDEVTSRIAVLDHEPTAMAGLELPGWARALQPSGVYGPVTATGTGLSLQTPKWLLLFNFSKTVQFVRGAQVLCVLPLSTFQLASSKQTGVLSGSAWIAAKLFAADAPADSFAGLAVQSGEVACDQPLAFAGLTVTVPAGATLTLNLVPAPSAAGPANFPATITAPTKITVTFPPAGTSAITFDHCAGTVYGEAIDCEPASLPVLYNGVLKLLYVQGKSAQAVFKPQPGPSKLLTLSGAGPVLSAGWALKMNETTTPATLGTASSSGEFAIVFGAGVSARWTGSDRPEPIFLGSVIAQNNALLVSGASGVPRGVVRQQAFQLWNDQDAAPGSKRRCRLLSRRSAGDLMTYALADDTETVTLTGFLQAQVDRPLLATGQRVPALFTQGTIALIKNNAGNRIVAASMTPQLQTSDPNQQITLYPLALDNALLDVTQPFALALNARADASFHALDGLFYLISEFSLVELFLPDPYTGSLTPSVPGRTGVTAVPGQNPTGASGFLVAEVSFPALDKVSLRLEDSNHKHPTTAPTTEAGSTVIPVKKPAYAMPQPVQPAPAPPQPVQPVEPAPVQPVPIEPVRPIAPVQPVAPVQPNAAVALRPETAVAKTNQAHAMTDSDAEAQGFASPAQQPRPTQPPPSDPAPSPFNGPTLLDLSTRASQLGVQVVNDRRQTAAFVIDGLSVRGPASLLPLATLPAIAWEPMYNRSTGDASVDDYELLHPPGDGPLALVRATSANLIPVSPLQSLQAVLDGGTGGSEAILTLPFGMVAFLATDTSMGDGQSVLPNIGLVQPVFASTLTPSGSVYTGAWQLSFTAPNPDNPDPVLAGRTYLRTEDDNPYPGYSYGEQVLGADVSDIFSSRFNPPEGSVIGTGVPLRRYDLTGYGASTFSEWSNITNPAPTDVIKAFFHVLIGRTSHEVIQVQSIIYPWAIKVVRTITIDRLASGTIHRYDSGWQAASDGLFEFPAATGITRNQIHSGLISGVINVKNIQQLGLPVETNGSPDLPKPGDPVPNPAPKPMPIAVQPVTFDADVIIQPHHQVVQGGVTLKDLAGNPHVCVPSKGVTGYIGLQYKYHLSLANMATFPPLARGAGGEIRASINVGGANSLLRATEFDAMPVHDTKPGGGIGIACAVRGLPKLSSDGSWSVAARAQNQAAPVPLPATQAAPVVQPNQGNTSLSGKEIHFANPADIFRLSTGAATPPDTLYGFLQATGTQSNFLSRPILTVGSHQLKLGDALNVAHAGALLGAISKFPGISQCLQFLGSELDKITNQLAEPSLATKQNLQLKPGVRSTPLNLIDISIAKVDLYFHWKDDDLTKPAEPPSVQIALGQPTAPSWSLDVNHIAIGLTIPFLSSDPVIWLQGNFHADADTTPAFPDLKVVFAGPLDPLTKFFTALEDIAKLLSPGGGGDASASAMELAPALLSPHDDDADESGGAGLHTHFADGKLTVTDNFSLPSIPLGPGTIDDVSLNIGAGLDILKLAVDFGVSIGTKDAPCHWIVDPLSGTIAIGAGIKNNKADIFVLAGIGLGLAIDLGIASGSASIVIAISLEINGSQITIMLLLTGQAQVSVLGGLASASISITCGLGLSFPAALPPPNVTMIGTASVGIHISICWVVNINFSGSWTFQKNFALKHPDDKTLDS